jgi:hypothetical protein
VRRAVPASGSRVIGKKADLAEPRKTGYHRQSCVETGLLAAEWKCMMRILDGGKKFGNNKIGESLTNVRTFLQPSVTAYLLLSTTDCRRDNLDTGKWKNEESH